MDGSRGYRLFANFKSGNWELLSLTGLREKIQPVSWAPTVFNDRGTRVRIPRDGDQRSEVMAITIPK
jgi:hypothetical protein